MEHMGWHRRGYLPHCDYAGNLQAVTFRLADSLPAKVIQTWREELVRDLNSEDSTFRRRALATLHRRMTDYEDAGHGSCLLRDAICAEIIQQTLIQSHGLRYRLIEWCVMPNHVHALFKEWDDHPLSRVIQGWKGTTSLLINRHLARTGRLWMPDYHDRLIRDEDHFWNARNYIRQNPVKARLCAEAEQWPFSSAGINWKP